MCSGNSKTDVFGEIFLGKVCGWRLPLDAHIHCGKGGGGVHEGGKATRECLVTWECIVSS